MIKISRFILVFTLIISSCSSEDNAEEKSGSDKSDSFDRAAMLVNWADNIIVPAFENFEASTQDLETAVSSFTSAPDERGLVELREAFRKAYLDFQTVSMFEIGKAEELNFRNYLNTYPASVTAIEQKIREASYNLELPSSYAEQGFPALDYLINGLGSTNAEIVSFYTSNTNASAYKAYLKDVATRINSLTSQVNASWNGDYRDAFVSNTSSSSTGSVDRFTNDYVMYFEKFVRSGKIGYPAGAFTGEPSPKNVEAYYSSGFSKTLYLEALKSVQDFFNGKHFSSNQSGKSYREYLVYMDSMKNDSDLAGLINTQFDAIRSQAETLDPSFKSQIANNNVEMLEAFDELQKQVVFLKVDMMQALSISVDYVDSDGD